MSDASRSCTVAWLACGLLCLALAGAPPVTARAEVAACAGYPVLSPSDVVATPGGMRGRRVTLTASGTRGVVVDAAGGASELWIDCQDGRHYRVARSAGRIEPAAAPQAGWATFSVTGKGQPPVVVDGKLYRRDLLPFDSEAPTDFPVTHNGNSYVLPFRRCPALDAYAPVYRIDDVSSQPPDRLTLSLDQMDYPIWASRQEVYNFGKLQPGPLNPDPHADLLLRYQERQGSGAEAFGAVLLNCEDGFYAVSGTLALGPVNAAAAMPVTQVRRVCGVNLTTLTIARSAAIDPARPAVRPRTLNDLYAYEPASRRYYFIAQAAKPFGAAFEPPGGSACVEMKREALQGMPAR